MPDRPFSGARLGRVPVKCAAAVFVALWSGCAIRPDPQAETAAAQAAGLDGAVAFRNEGGPLDEPAAGASLGLVEAAQRAVTTSPELQSALARVRIAMADADQARLLPNPVLNVVLRWGPGSAQIEASLAQDLVQALQARRRAGAADNRLRQAASDAVTVALDVVVEAQERYTNVQALDAMVPLLQDRLVLLRKLADTAVARREAGEGTRTEVVVLDAQRIELEVEIAAVELQRREERLHLARLIGEPSSSATWTLDSWVPPEPAAEPESLWIEAALAHRPEVQAVAWQLAALGDERALARAAPWEGAGAGVEAQRDDAWFVGPSVAAPIPVFDMGQARRARATAQQIEARHQLTLARRKVVEEVRVAYQTFTAGRANVGRIRNELIPLQEQRRRVIEDVYKAERDITPLLLAEHDLRTAQARAIDAERQAAVALFRLQRAVGGRAAEREVHRAAPEAQSPPAQSERPAPLRHQRNVRSGPHSQQRPIIPGAHDDAHSSSQNIPSP